MENDTGDCADLIGILINFKTTAEKASFVNGGPYKIRKELS